MGGCHARWPLSVESFASGADPTLRREPRILRDVQRLWGFDSLTIREVQ